MMGGAPILLAEDRPQTGLSICKAFQQAGIFAPLHSVPNVLEVLEYLSGTGIYADRFQFPLPCLLIIATELRMMDGFDLRVWLQGQPQFQRLPKIVLSPSAHEAMLMRALTMDCWACFLKPQEPHEWLSLIEHLRDTWLQPSAIHSVA